MKDRRLGGVRVGEAVAPLRHNQSDDGLLRRDVRPPLGLIDQVRRHALQHRPLAERLEIELAQLEPQRVDHLHPKVFHLVVLHPKVFHLVVAFGRRGGRGGGGGSPAPEGGEDLAHNEGGELLLWVGAVTRRAAGSLC